MFKPMHHNAESDMRRSFWCPCLRGAATVLFALAMAACSRAPSPAAGAAGAAAASSASPATAVAEALQAASDASAAPDASATLAAYAWQLATATDASGRTLDALFARPDKPLQLNFTAHALAVSNTCNRMRATYALAGNRMRIANLATTLMACPDPRLAALDTAAASALSGTSTYTLDARAAAPRLTLVTVAGEHLTFAGTPTATTRFGSAGTMMFLDVAPATRPCEAGAPSGPRCLYVRELHYTAAGLRKGQPGPWHVLAEPIEGYTHAPGVATMLRVKRYALAHPPRGAAPVAYVLDMVVESHAPTQR
ncbi:MAG TPA: META domain-containing protein [Rhodanobacteraceae bacterium]